MKRIRKHKSKTAVIMLFCFALQMVPQNLLALTGGPSQPEVQSFQPIGVSDMVDLFSGDFQYNLPLLDIDGYPINLSYSGQVSTDMEASWVGLGWNLNPGAITRSMRGIPDEFKGDAIRKENNIKTNKSYTVNLSKDFEIFGKEKSTNDGTDSSFLNIKAGLELRYDNYNGFSLAGDVSAANTISSYVGGEKTSENTYSLSLSSSSAGLSISPDVSFSKLKKRKEKMEFDRSLNIGLNYNSRAGLTDLSFGIQKRRLDVQIGQCINLGLESHTPYVETPVNNTSISFTFKNGAKFTGVFANTMIKGSVTWQRLKQKVTNVAAYGYLHTEKADKNSMLDINREKDGSFNKNTPLLPITNYTYDLFSVNGQGISGTFRPFRSEVGNLYDRNSENTTFGGGAGIDLGFGNAVKNGFNISVNIANSVSGLWDDKYNSSGTSRFPNILNSSKKDYEPYAYKQLGETTTDDEGYIPSSFKGSEPLRMSIAPSDISYRTMPSLLDQYNAEVSLPTSNHRSQRIRRNQHLSVLNRSEVERFGLENNLELMYNAAPHHPAEMTVLKDDGARYVYGIAAYNCVQEETSFNTGRREKNAHQQIGMDVDIDKNNGLVRYDYEDNTMDNNRGLDNYYSNTIMPGYAHSFLLTAILSTDYVDIDGIKGPSSGDIGSYTKFTYTKLDKVYKWRFPYEQFMANLNEGLYSDLDDNHGNYTYGEKEQWYLSKIETKNSVAIFTIEDRKDGFGVIDKNGGMGDECTKLLRKITLYSKKDYEVNQGNAVAVKAVNFEYSYELCPGIPNNNGNNSGPDDNSAKGKLTLKKVFFTYGTSLRGKFSPYTFEYNSSGLNPAYGLKNNDRWGNYKPNNAQLYNSEFPYVDQDKTLADNYTQAWLLKAITLPSGGKINITYESDDYAYVQDQNAMQMFKITAFVNDVSNPGSIDYTNNTDNSLISDAPALINRQYLIFKLHENISRTGGATPTQQQKEEDHKIYKSKYLKSIDNLYFRIKADITNKEDYEYVSGYCELEDYNNLDNAFLLSDGTATGYYTHGYIKIKNVDIGDGDGLGLNVHPMAKACWQFGRLNMNRALYSGVDDHSSNLQKFISTISDATFIRPLFQALQGQNGYLMNTNCGKKVQLDHSFIKLYNPNGKKLGGGCRVKKITISDQWNTMIPNGNSADESVYGQEYFYTTVDSETGSEISSGVASNEPGIGNDESPLKQPIYFGNKEQKLLAPDDKFYLEEPIGEMFFPNPSVGYSKITVRNLQHTGVNRHATGKVVNEFYTAKDFPVIVKKTPLESKVTSITPLLKAFKKYTRAYVTASQGFSIELNDMHGKPKSVWVYAEDNNNPISGTEYRYKCSPYQKNSKSAKGFRLNNTVQVLYPDGKLSNKEIGVEYDLINDFRQETTTSYSGGFRGNLDNFFAGVIAVTAPSLFMSANSDRRGFRSAVMTKVVNRYGLVEEVIAYDLGSKVGTKNLTYDSETGDVILTQTKNEFEDDIYSFTYPAHWYYKGMGPAYKNYKLSFDDVDFSSGGVAVIENAGDWFVEGDEIISGNEKGWVTQVDPGSGTITVVNEIGKPYKPLQNDQDILIIRSGRRNILRANIGSIVSMDNPIPGLMTNSFSRVVNSASQVFRDDWKTYCECFDGESAFMKISSNPYATGRKGIWRPYKSYTFLSNRELTIQNNNTNIRHDGTYTRYTPFWQWNGSVWNFSTSNWTWTSEITEYSPFGMELENKDPLNRYSAATYGYNNSLPLSVAANAKYSDIGFDGFEDYDFSNCTNDHFSYKIHAGEVVTGSSHSGKRSIRVSTSTDVKLSKPIQNCNQ